MKNKLIIILVVLILLLGGVWVYLLLNGAPKSVADLRDNIFGKATTIAVAPSQTSPIETVVPDDNTPRTVPTKAQLVKLTDRITAGATFASTSAGVVVRYVVKGTGHVYEINLESGKETRISGRVLPQVVEAHWSPLGTRAILITDDSGLPGDTFLATLQVNNSGEMLFDTEKIGAIENTAFTSAGDQLLYTQKNAGGGTTGFSRSLRTGAIAELFSVPFGESAMLWDTWVAGTSTLHYIYTKPALGFMGYLYALEKGGLRKVDSAYTLTALRTDHDTFIVNKRTGGGPYGLLLDMKKGTGNFLSIQTLSEKCGGVGDTVWCGTVQDAVSESFPIDWYQGAVTFADSLYRIDKRTGDAKFILDPEVVSRERIDITDLIVSENGPIIFKNKEDDALWLFNPPS